MTTHRRGKSTRGSSYTSNTGFVDYFVFNANFGSIWIISGCEQVLINIFTPLEDTKVRHLCMKQSSNMYKESQKCKIIYMSV